ncbi:MAG: hypothetical protein CSA19_01615, partial [Deltaproteobacteria bacterium]
YGQVVKLSATSIVGKGLLLGIGDIVLVVSKKTPIQTYAMVIALEEEFFFLSAFSHVEGIRSGDYIYMLDRGMHIKVGKELLGRVVDPMMKPLDFKPAPKLNQKVPIMRSPIAPMKRGLISKLMPTGVKSIDGLLTFGVGQKMGIFAGSGVGKSTLLSMIVKGAKAPIKVVALIGERGREIPEFIENNLGGDLTNTIIIVATSDDSALMRKYGAFCAMAVAEYFKSLGEDVLFVMDSVTRFAMAQREIGLSLGEPPTTKGYPPSVFALLPQLMERAGNEKGSGSISAFFTILIEGDDMNDPVADQARSILDGHIVLSRELTDFGIYPPVDVLSSASRLVGDLCDNEQMMLGINTGKEKIAVKQIAGLVARRIVCEPNSGEQAVKGERYGLIKFGSRLDIYLPKSAAIKVQIGDKVVAGE